MSIPPVVVEHHARCTRCGRIAVAVPTPGIVAPSCGCTGCGSLDYRLATAAEVEAVPHGSTMTVVALPMTWAAEARRAVLQAHPVFQRCPIAIADGWLTLLEQLVGGIEALPGGAAIRASDVKEKFGGLRFYSYVDHDALAALPVTDGYGGPTADDLIDAAEAESKCTCEWCGDAGATVSINGWSTTLCPRHQTVDKIIRCDVDRVAWRHWLCLPKTLPARAGINQIWAALLAQSDQLKAIGITAIGIGLPGDNWPLESAGVYVGANSDEARTAAMDVVQELLSGWPVRPWMRGDCHRFARLDDQIEYQRAALAGHPLMRAGATVKMGHPDWAPIIAQLLADLATTGVPEGRIKAIRPAPDGRLSVHPTLRGEAARLVLEAAEKAAIAETGRAG